MKKLTLHKRVMRSLNRAGHTDATDHTHSNVSLLVSHVLRMARAAARREELVEMENTRLYTILSYEWDQDAEEDQYVTHHVWAKTAALAANKFHLWAVDRASKSPHHSTWKVHNVALTTVIQ